MERKKDIYIDVESMMIVPFISGIQRVVREGTKWMIQHQDDQNWRIRLIKWDKNREAFQLLDNENYLLWLDGKTDKEACEAGQMLLPQQISAGSVFFDLDSVWLNDPNRGYLLSLLKHRGVKIAAFIHDIIPITHPQYAHIDENYLALPKYIDAELAYADLVFTTTEYVKGEICELLKKLRYDTPKFALAPLGADFKKCRKSDPKIDLEVKQIARSGPYLLTVGTIETRKNQQLLLDAYDNDLQGRGINLIFAGRVGWEGQAFTKRLLEHPKFGKSIFFFEGKNDETISYLYQTAFFNVFPTFMEGYGMPAVEALLSGTPTLLSDIPVMHEVAGTYADYFDPKDPKQLAKLVLDGLADQEGYAKKKRELASYKPRTWKQFGEDLAKGLHSLF